MTILGIDPGPHYTAYVLWDTDQNKILECNEPTRTDKGIKHGCLNEIALAKIQMLDDLFHYDTLAVEMVECMGMVAGISVFVTTLWIGRYYQAGKHIKKEVLLIPRRMVKMNLCNSMRAKDANIRQALIDRFGPQGTKKDPGFLYNLHGDMLSAMAVAATTHDNYGNIEDYLKKV